MQLASCVVFLTAVGHCGGAELVLPSLSLERDRPVVAVFRTALQATGKGELALEWTDVLGRVVERRKLPVELTDETEIRFPLDLRRAVAMENELHAHLSLDGVNAKGEKAHREEDASVRFVARPGARRWNDYEIMMWQPHTTAQAAALKTLSINAGQFNGHNPALPEFLIKNNMRWYAENLATDFYSEYHRFRPDRIQQWSWLQAKALLKKDLDSKEAFKRHPSFSDPLWLTTIHDRLVERTRSLSPYRPIFYNLGDESGIADLAAFWDFDFSDQSLSEMRIWLRERYGTLAAVNRQWGTSYASWDLVTPQTTREAMRRTDSNYSSWADHKEWMDVSYARALKMGVDAIHSVDPDAYVAIEGGQMPGWGGYDYYRLTQVLDAIEPYDIGSNIEMIRSFKPSMAFVTTAFARGPWEKHRIWFELLHGARGNIIWEDKPEHVAEDGSIGERGREVEPYYRELRSGIAALLINSVRQSDPVAIHYSQASMRTEWMLAQRPKGDAWIDRTSSSERMDSEFLGVRESYCRLLEDLGLQYKFVAYAQVEAGELLHGGYRALILPRSSSLSDAEVAEIREFASRGGLVIADGEPGVFDEHSRRREKGALDDLFDASRGAKQAVRMDALSYYQLRLASKEGPLHESAEKLFRTHGIEPPFAVLDANGHSVVGVELHRFQNGGVTIAGLLSNPQQRVDELGPPEFKSNARFEKPVSFRLALPAEYYVYDVRGAKALGRKRELAVTLDPYEPAIYALSQSPLPALRISAPSRVARGETAHISLAFDGVTPAEKPVVHVEVLDPSGQAAPDYCANVVLTGGSGEQAVPFAVSDAPGRWTVRVKDLLSGQQQESGVEVY
jgi:hypothetical protein